MLFLIGELASPELIQPVAEGFDQERKFLRIGLARGPLSDFVPVGIGELRVI